MEIKINRQRNDQNTNTAQRAAYDKEAYKAYKRQERKELFAMAEDILDEISVDLPALNQYLAIQGKLGYSSLMTTLLVMAQQPDATQIRDFDSWLQLGRMPRKGTGIRVFEANGEYHCEDGTSGIMYSVKRVFDVSQTDGKSLNVRTKPTIRSLLKALCTESPVPIRLADSMNPNTTEAFSETDKSVFVQRSRNGNELFADIVEKLTKANRLDDFHAKCVATIVCTRYGIPIRDIEQIPEWLRLLEPGGKKATFALIRQASCDIMERVDRNLAAERLCQRTEQEREAR